MNFDLISDLHIDLWDADQKLNFKGLGTSLNCIVAGDVSKKLTTTRDFLFQLSHHYKQVIFVDGNHEHKPDYSNIVKNCEWLEEELSKKSNITYLWDSTCVFDNVAIVGTNGWWSFDYSEPHIPKYEQIDDFCRLYDCPNDIAIRIWDESIENGEFLYNIVSEFNKAEMINEIVVVTHTLPRKDLITISNNMQTADLAKMYSSNLSRVLEADVNGKITTWCFGHYHDEACDRTIDGIRYISNPRGRPDDSIFPIYYPKLITL